jgi:hypothetical protein
MRGMFENFFVTETSTPLSNDKPDEAYRNFLWHVLQRTFMPTSLLHFGQRLALRANFNLVRGR